MKTKTLLNKIKKHHGGSWHDMAKGWGITYSYICYLRRDNNEAGKFLKEKLTEYAKAKGLIK